ncbi:MAG: hypothetical protein WCX22_03420 [Methanoregula sp.]
MRNFVLIMGIILGLFLVGGVSATDFGPWTTETVDSIGNVGEYSSLALNFSDYPRISYYDQSNHNLKYAAWDGKSWKVETVDGLTKTIADRPHNGKDNKHAEVGEYSSLALDANGNPRISYYDKKNTSLKYVAWSGTSWEIETADGSTKITGKYQKDGKQDHSADVGEYSSLALDANGNPRISYYDKTHGDLKYAAWSGTSWKIETVDGISRTFADRSLIGKNDRYTEVGRYSSLALDADGNPKISYYDQKNGDLKYAAWDGTSWKIETVDGITKIADEHSLKGKVYRHSEVGEYSSLSLDTDGNPKISYYDKTHGALKYAVWNGTAWEIETVDSSGKVGEFTSLRLDGNNDPRIAYYDRTNKDLKFAAWNGAVWQIETVDNSKKVGTYASLALDPAGDAYISYYDQTNHDLKYAQGNGHRLVNEIAGQLYGQDITQGEYLEKVWPEMLVNLSPEATQRLYETEIIWDNKWDPSQLFTDGSDGSDALLRSAVVSKRSASSDLRLISLPPTMEGNSELDKDGNLFNSFTWTGTTTKVPMIGATTMLQTIDGPAVLDTRWIPVSTPVNNLKLKASYVDAKQSNQIVHAGYYRTNGFHSVKWDNPDAQLPWCSLLKCDWMGVETNSPVIWYNAEATEYRITPLAGSSGSISPSEAVIVPSGGSRTFTVTPNSGYAVEEVRVDGISLGAVSSYTFTSVRRDHAISATFKKQSLPPIVPLCPAGTPFDSSKYPQNTAQSDAMTFSCNWDGAGQVYISGDPSALTGVYADDGYIITIQPSGKTFDAPEHWAHQHPVIELTSGMTPGTNTFTLIVKNWQSLSMSYAAWNSGSTTNFQNPYIIQVNTQTLSTLVTKEQSADELPSFITLDKNGLMINGTLVETSDTSSG